MCIRRTVHHTARARRGRSVGARQPSDRTAGGDPTTPGTIAAPHGVAMDPAGNLYDGEMTYTARVRAGKMPPSCHVFQRFVRVR